MRSDGPDEDSVANALSLAESTKQCHVTFNSHKADCFHCQMEPDAVEFNRSTEGLCTTTLSEVCLAEVKRLNNENEKIPVATSHMSTAAESRGNCATAEFERAKAARKLCHASGAPSAANHKKILRSNQMKDCPAVEKDADVATTNFGPDVATLEGKTPQRTPRAMIQDLIVTPPELVRKHSSIDLCVGVTHINEIRFMTLISHPICFRKTATADNGKTETMCDCSDKISQACNSGGHRIDVIDCDNGFCSIMEDVKDESKCSMNCTAAQDHEPRVERNNGTVKNQAQVGLHQSTHEIIPRVMIEEPVATSTDKFNCFPAKHGISQHCSPQTSVTGKTLDCKKQCQHEFGEHTQADTHDEPGNGVRE